MIKWCLLLLLCSFSLGAQTAPATSPNPFKPLAFLEGTWEAKTQDPKGPTVAGRYTFAHELDGHVFARHATNDPGCKAPATFDCQHGDLLYVFQDAPGQPFKAIYFDNEGHVLHYDVSVTGPNMVTFLSQPSPGPQFRLIYERKGGTMNGKFQMQVPGQTEWHSYLEWSGGKL